MTLTKSDISAIRRVVKEEVKNETRPQFEKLNKGQKRIENKFDELFDFLDRDWSKLANRTSKIENHLGFRSSEN